MATIGENQFWASVASLARSAEKIARMLEVMAEEKKPPTVDPDSLGAMALWREEVASGNTVLGFSEWVAWHKKDPGDG